MDEARTDHGAAAAVEMAATVQVGRRQWRISALLRMGSAPALRRANRRLRRLALDFRQSWNGDRPRILGSGWRGVSHAARGRACSYGKAEAAQAPWKPLAFCCLQTHEQCNGANLLSGNHGLTPPREAHVSSAVIQPAPDALSFVASP